MKEEKIKSALVAICLAGCAGLAQAQAPSADRGLYLGAGLGQSEAKEYDCRSVGHCDNRGAVVKFFAGWQFARHWAFELGYTDLGQIDSANDTGTFRDQLKSRLGEATLLLSYPASARLSVYAKGGAYYARTTHDHTEAGVSTRTLEDAGGPTWGFGLQYFITNHLGVR